MKLEDPGEPGLRCKILLSEKVEIFGNNLNVVVVEVPASQLKLGTFKIFHHVNL